MWVERSIRGRANESALRLEGKKREPSMFSILRERVSCDCTRVVELLGGYYASE